MASDNVQLETIAVPGDTAATDYVTYSGDGAMVQLTRNVHVTGAEESKTVHEIMFAEDAGHTSGDYGYQLLTVRQDAAASLSGTDADYQPLITTATGELWTEDKNSDAILADTTAILADTTAILADTAAIQTSVEIMDDWDESDRAKVNLIVGQAGIAANASAMGATVPCVTIATDDTHFGAVGAASDIDGVVHGQLRYMADQLVTIDSDTDAIKTATEKIDDAIFVDDAEYTLGTSSGIMAMGFAGTQSVNADDAAALACTTGGALYIQEASAMDVSAATVTVDCNSTAVTIDNTLDQGNADAGTIRVAIADDDTLLTTIDADTGAIKTAVELLDNAVSGAGYNITQLGGTNITMDEGVHDAGCQRVTLATDDDGVAHLATIAGDTTSIDADTTAIKNSVEIMDDWDDGFDHCEVVITTGSDVIGKLAANSGVDIGDVDVASIPGQAEHSESAATTGILMMGRNQTGIAVGASEAGLIAINENSIIRVNGATAESATIDTGDDPVLIGGRYDLAERTTTNQDATTLAMSPQGWAMVGNQSSYLFDGPARAEIKRASGLAASGTTAMVAAVASYQIRVLALALIATSATVTNVYIANDDNDLLGDSSNPIPLATDADGDNAAGLVLPYNPGGWFQTDTDNEALNLILSAAQDVIYAITYMEVT